MAVETPFDKVEYEETSRIDTVDRFHWCALGYLYKLKNIIEKGTDEIESASVAAATVLNKVGDMLLLNDVILDKQFVTEELIDLPVKRREKINGNWDYKEYLTPQFYSSNGAKIKKRVYLQLHKDETADTSPEADTTPTCIKINSKDSTLIQYNLMFPDFTKTVKKNPQENFYRNIFYKYEIEPLSEKKDASQDDMFKLTYNMWYNDKTTTCELYKYNSDHGWLFMANSNEFGFVPTITYNSSSTLKNDDIDAEQEKSSMFLQMLYPDYIMAPTPIGNYDESNAFKKKYVAYTTSIDLSKDNRDFIYDDIAELKEEGYYDKLDTSKYILVSDNQDVLLTRYYIKDNELCVYKEDKEDDVIIVKEGSPHEEVKPCTFKNTEMFALKNGSCNLIMFTFTTSESTPATTTYIDESLNVKISVTVDGFEEEVQTPTE